MAEEVVPEEYGGDAPFIEVSAKKAWALMNCSKTCCCKPKFLELKAPVDAPAKGLVIEAKLDKGKGAVARFWYKAVR